MTECRLHPGRENHCTSGRCGECWRCREEGVQRTHLDLHFPRRGQCLICCVPGVDQRHRVVDAIRERVCAGDGEEEVARDYGISVTAVRVAATALDGGEPA